MGLRKLLFLLAVFCTTVLLMAVQKPVFLFYYAHLAEGVPFAELCRVVWHGLRLDMTIAGYVTVVPLLVTLLSLWVRFPERLWRRILLAYFVLVSVAASLIFAVDIALYAHWGFRLDATILIYLADPKEAMASVDWGLGLRQTLFFVVCAAVMIWAYSRVVRLFDGERLPAWRALLWTLGLLLAGGLDFLAIRGGVGASVANVSKVYFSSDMFLNHAAVNPVFSFLSSLDRGEDYASEYLFFDEQTRAANFESLRGNGPASGPTEKVLRADRPNVVVVILESFSRPLMDERVDGEPVMRNMQEFKKEGIWFENFYANSFRTDRGEVAILSGFPGQTNVSIMKLPNKSANLPSLARTLGREGYRTSFTYGGDLNFTDQASYMYATGWQKLTWQKDLHFKAKPSKWGYDDAVVCDYFTDQVLAQSASGEPFLAGLLTLSSHEPFEVPFCKFDDPVFNAMAFTDDCLGRMIQKLKASPAWDNLLVVLVADHGYPYPNTLMYNEPRRHHIPMLWLGGALAGPRVVEEYASQIDICATVLAQLGMSHDDFDYSKDIFAPAPPRKFAYYVIEEGFGVLDASGQVIYDILSDRTIRTTNPQLLEIGQTMLQTTYQDLAKR